MDFLSALNGPQAADSAMPDITATPPTTPEEVAQRKQGWKSVLDEINTNPAMQQALLVAGLQLMRPRANLGEAGLAGLATYNDAIGQQQQAERQQKKDARDEQLFDLQSRKAQADLDWMEQRRPLELQKLQGEIDLLPGEAEKQSLALQLKRIELAQAPEVAKLELAKLRAQIAASNRSGAAAFKPTDQENAIQALMQSSEFKDLPENDRRAAATREFYTGLRVPPRAGALTDTERAVQGLMETPEIQALPPEQRRAAATQKYHTEMRSAPTQVKHSYEEQQAMALAKAVDADPEKYAMQMLDVAFAQRVAFGQSLLARENKVQDAGVNAEKQTNVLKGAAEVTKKVIDAATVRKQREAAAAAASSK